MNDDKLLEVLRARRASAVTRIDMSTLPVPPLYEAIPASAVDSVEAHLHVPIPALLRRIYVEVGNGGFGPGGGLLGLTGGYPDADGRTLLERYNYHLQEGWKKGLLPLFDWGDGAWSAADAQTSRGTIVTADELGFTETAFDLHSWFSAWTDGADLFSEIYEIESATITNPFTKKSTVIRQRGRAKGRSISALTIPG